MAKRRTKQWEPVGAPKGTATASVQEKEQDKAPEKGGSDVPAAARDVVISAPMHCDGCARKLRHYLQRIDGVEEATVDSRTNTVVVSGPTAVENATEVLEIVERKTGKEATLLSPSLEKLPSPSPAVKGGGTKKDDASEDMANETTKVDMYLEMVVVLRMNLHCDGCSEEIKRRILRIKGVEEAVPQLKSSQVMVKGTVEPATLVGFIHKSTGRKAAIIRAEPLDLLLASKTPPVDAPFMGGETKHEDQPDNSGEKKEGLEHGKKEAPQQENRGGEEDDKVDEKPRTEKPSGGYGGEEQETHADEDPNNGRDEFVLENNKKDDYLFRVPLPAGVVTVAPEIALNNLHPYYGYPTYPAHLYHQYQYPQPCPYACSPAMYGYPHPEAFSEENPNACTIM